MVKMKKGRASCLVAGVAPLLLAVAGLSGTLAHAQRARSQVQELAVPPGAAVSADGLRAAWPSADHRSILSSTRASTRQSWSAPLRLLTTRGKVGKIVFSPDGRSIAYENPRTWHDDGSPNDSWQLIGVYDIATRQISYVDPSFDVDSDPVWSADSRSISFTRSVYGLPGSHLTRPVVRRKLAGWKPPGLRASERFTMAAVLSAPFIYPPVPSADGRSLAYVTRETTDRNIYFWRVGEPVRRIVNYPGDDGQDLEDLAVSPAGGAVAYVRGDRLNGQGDAPNPASLPDLPQRQVWVIGTRDDMPRLVGPGSEPLFTPDRRFLLWRENGKYMRVALFWDKERLAGVGSPEEFRVGTREGLRFSPDGSRVVYRHGDGLEVYTFASQTAVAIPHGTDVDLDPVWSPDSKRIAFRRIPADSAELPRNSCGLWRYCGPAVSSKPWAIWTVDVSDWMPHRIWQAHPGVGSVYYRLDQSYSPGQHGDQMFWSADDRIAFVWESDGWRHLYSVPASGGKAVLLTPGEGEVETAAVSLDRRQIVYATNIGDLPRRHIAVVGFDGSPAVNLTHGPRSQWAPTPLAGGAVAYVRAGWSDPAKVVVRQRRGSTEVGQYPTVPSVFPADKLVEPKPVEFAAADGEAAFGDIFVPVAPQGCAVIFSHGGIRRQMLPGFHYMDAYHYLYELNQYLASRGCVVLSVEYRSSIMRGEAFRDAPGWGFAGNSELLDFIGAAKYLVAQQHVDPRRIGIYGLSWGGYMTANALAQRSDIFKVGFDMAGVHFAPDPVGYSHSALGHLATWRSPVFLVQGDDDMNVDFDQGIALARALETRHPDVELKLQVVPGHTHDLQQTYQELVEVYTEGSDFLLHHLGVK